MTYTINTKQSQKKTVLANKHPDLIRLYDLRAGNVTAPILTERRAFVGHGKNQKRQIMHEKATMATIN